MNLLQDIYNTSNTTDKIKILFCCPHVTDTCRMIYHLIKIFFIWRTLDSIISHTFSTFSKAMTRKKNQVYVIHTLIYTNLTFFRFASVSWISMKFSLSHILWIVAFPEIVTETLHFLNLFMRVDCLCYMFETYYRLWGYIFIHVCKCYIFFLFVNSILLNFTFLKTIYIESCFIYNFILMYSVLNCLFTLCGGNIYSLQ